MNRLPVRVATSYMFGQQTITFVAIFLHKENNRKIDKQFAVEIKLSAKIYYLVKYVENIFMNTYSKHVHSTEL